MKKQKLIVSANQVVGIRKFMENYLKVEYDEESKLSHYMMEQYLIEKGHVLPMKVSYSDVTIDSINDGTYVVVREETKRAKRGKMLIYKNPIKEADHNLLEELKQTANKDELREIRRKNLLECFDLVLTGDDKIVPLENFNETNESEEQVFDHNLDVEDYYVDNSVNRQRVYKMSSRRHLMGRRRY